jgi:hypothetical protein
MVRFQTGSTQDHFHHVCVCVREREREREREKGLPFYGAAVVKIK